MGMIARKGSTGQPLARGIVDEPWVERILVFGMVDGGEGD